jgi:hypothetical protein
MKAGEGDDQLTCELETPQNAKVLGERRICQELHYAACDTIDRKDRADVTRIQAKPAGEVKWQLRVVRGMLLDWMS